MPTSAAVANDGVRLVLAVLLCFAASAQNQAPAAGSGKAPIQRRYLPNMADEDWSFLKDRAQRRDPWDSLKFMSLGREGWYLSISGEARLSPQGFRVRGDEQFPSTVDNYLLQRYLLGVDLRMGERVRFYGELQSGLIQGRIGSPRPRDQDLLEMHQGFFEFRSKKEAKSRWGLRVGRQELNIGSGRLIAPSQGLNVKRSFDGLTATWTRDDWTLEGGLARLVRIVPGAFDDPPDAEQTFWGFNAARRRLPWKGSQLNFYYMGIDKKSSVYVQGIGSEDRHTVGSRVSGRWSKMDYNYDIIGQWGSFKGVPVRAWAFSTDTGVALRFFRWPARLGVTFNSASGDRDPRDASLQSFNPLFPGNAYSGIVGLLGPTNLTDVTPSFKVPVRRNLIVAFEMPSYFRNSTGDGVYAIDLRLLLPGQRNSYRHVGTNPGVIVAWQANGHLAFNGAITRFQSGQFLSDTLFRNGFGFYSIAATYRF